MKWDQIETKWALMTRRIRADFCDDRSEQSNRGVHTLKRRDTVIPSVGDGPFSAPRDAECKTSAK
jgi:hypothetical protein